MKIATATIATAELPQLLSPDKDMKLMQLNKDIIQMILLHIATLTLSINKVTTITLGKVTGAQIV